MSPFCVHPHSGSLDSSLHSTANVDNFGQVFPGVNIATGLEAWTWTGLLGTRACAHTQSASLAETSDRPPRKTHFCADWLPEHCTLCRACAPPNHAPGHVSISQHNGSRSAAPLDFAGQPSPPDHPPISQSLARIDLCSSYLCFVLVVLTSSPLASLVEIPSSTVVVFPLHIHASQRV